MRIRTVLLLTTVATALLVFSEEALPQVPPEITISQCVGYEIVIIGTEGDDLLIGTDDEDCIIGLGGNDNLVGGERDDRLFGEAHHDRLFGQAGADLLVGGAGDDHIFGGENDDRLGGGADNDRLTAGTGNDQLAGGSGNDSLDGGGGSDRLRGGPGQDGLVGDGFVATPGNDTIDAADDERDSIICGRGVDTVFFDRGLDVFVVLTGSRPPVVQQSFTPIGCESALPR